MSDATPDTSSESETLVEVRRNKRDVTRFGLTVYEGYRLATIRVWTEKRDEPGVMAPTKKGISLRIEQIPDAIEALKAVEADAKKRGWL